MRTDVFVLGGGIAGVAAAVSAASRGLSVVLADMNPFAGGMASAGLVSPFMKHEIRGQALVRGIFENIEQRMRDMNAMVDHGFYGSAFRAASWQMLMDHGVTCFFNSFAVSAQREGKMFTNVTLKTPDSIMEISAQRFIDCSGDAGLLTLAGLPVEKGETLQALTLFFRMGGIDMEAVAADVSSRPDNFFPWVDREYRPDRIMSVAGYFREVAEARELGRMHPDIQYIFFTSLHRKGEGAFNTTNILGLDGSVSRDLTAAEWIGRKQVHDVVDRLAAGDIPGFSSAVLLETAPQVGVRETGRAVGDYAVTGDDIRNAVKFRDAVARGCYGVDIHGQKNESSVMEDLPEGEYYEIPYRALLVRDADNVLAAGRCISSTREGHGALRIMPTSAATGEAAGTAAALSLITGRDLRSLDMDVLRSALEHNLLPLE